MKDKSLEEMNFHERIKWAQEVIVQRFFENGLSGIREATWLVVEQIQRYPMKKKRLDSPEGKGKRK